jgi:alpha-L-arabinofuranosidase
MKRLLSLLTFFALSTSLQAQKKLTVFANEPVAEISPTMWGIFFEDINFGADGGLYAEMIKNRSFEFPMPMTGWREIRNGNASGRMVVENSGKETAANTRCITVSADAQNGSYGLANEGFRGMGFGKGETYRFSVAAKAVAGGKVRMRIEAVNAAGKKIGEALIENLRDSAWKTYQSSFTTTDSAAKGRLNVWLEGTGDVQLDNISLFPANTWKGRPNGLRKDLVQWLADMQPGFIRFPGGCIVEGRDLTSRYQWKKTVGPVDQRPFIINRWNNEMRNRQAPDYFQSFGLGFYEYFLLSEDLGAEPVPILNCGMACQFNSAEVVAMAELDPYLQDALDLIEFANGSTETQWGGLRAAMGHPAPFNLKYLGIGNENWGPEYIERLKIFTKAIKEKYPAIQLVGSTGTDPHFKPFSQEGFDYLDGALRGLKIDIMDEHFYRSPEWFAANAGRYDSYDRKGPKIFAGEYAAHTQSGASGEKMNNWSSALAEAAFMTGLERNADVVTMASYAPLFAHRDAWQWAPDMIWFDNLRSYGTPNYYVQKLFALNRGTHLLSVLSDGAVLNGKDSLYASAVLDKKAKAVILKVVNAASSPAAVTLDLKGAKATKETVLETLAAADKQAVNSLENAEAIAPRKQMISSGEKTIPLQPLSLNVITIPLQ